MLAGCEQETERLVASSACLATQILSVRALLICTLSGDVSHDTNPDCKKKFYSLGRCWMHKPSGQLGPDFSLTHFQPIMRCNQSLVHSGSAIWKTKRGCWGFESSHDFQGSKQSSVLCDTLAGTVMTAKPPHQGKIQKIL